MTTINGLNNSTTNYVTLESPDVKNAITSSLSTKQISNVTTTTGTTKYIQLQSVRPSLTNAIVTSQATLSTAGTTNLNISNASPSAAVSQRPISTGFNIPPGMVLTRTSNGQYLLVNGNQVSNNTPQPTVNSVQPVVMPASRITTPIAVATNSSLVTTIGKTVAVVTPATTFPKSTENKPAIGNPTPVQLSQEDLVNVNKCRNFLTTLIKLASNGGQPQETVRNVKTLVQNLIDDKIPPGEFTKKLQSELKSSPQPYLIPFLKRSLPLLRLTMMQQNQGGSVPTAVAQAAIRVSSLQTENSKTSALPLQKTVTKVTKPLSKFVRTNVPDIRLPRVNTTGPPLKHPSLQTPPPEGPPQPQFHAPHPSSVTGARSSTLTTMKPYNVSLSRGNQRWNAGGTGGSGGSYKEDDDINDVASMAGVNLSEESARILATNSELVGTQTRSCRDDSVLNTAVLQKKMSLIASRNPLIKHIHPDAVKFLSFASEWRLKDLIHKLSAAVRNRHVSFQEEEHYKACGDVKTQLKFLHELDRIEKKKHEEAERDILMKAIKSRSKTDNPEQLRLKERAKEMQQMELEKMQIRNADETARNAIGPRKKKLKLDPSMSTSSSVLENHVGTTSRNMSRSRTKRANLRDLMFVMENERSTCKSIALYKSYLK